MHELPSAIILEVNEGNNVLGSFSHILAVKLRALNQHLKMWNLGSGLY